MIYYINANTQPQELEPKWNDPSMEQTSRMDENVIKEQGSLENRALPPHSSAQPPAAEDEHYIMWGADLKAGHESQSTEQTHNASPPPPPPPLLHRLGQQQQGDYIFR